MGREVTDFRIDQVSIQKGVFDALPLEARRRFQAYWEKARVKNEVLTFELPAYRAKTRA